MKFWRIVETDNYGGDYPDERFCLPPFATKERAQYFADLINDEFCDSRFWKVVELPYKLQPGFEP